MTLPQIHQRLVDAHGLRLQFAEFAAAWLEPYSAAMPGMAHLLQTLSRRYRLALLSNVDRYYFEVVRANHPELVHFEFELLSCDLGLAKPDPRIFRHVCEVAGVAPSQCFFVDDTLINIEAAQALGFRGHLFRSVAGLVESLSSAGVDTHSSAHLIFRKTEC